MINGEVKGGPELGLIEARKDLSKVGVVESSGQKISEVIRRVANNESLKLMKCQLIYFSEGRGYSMSPIPKDPSRFFKCNL